MSIHLAQGAAKAPEVKYWGPKRLFAEAPPVSIFILIKVNLVAKGLASTFFSELKLWPLIVLLSLEIIQEHCNTFKVLYGPRW